MDTQFHIFEILQIAEEVQTKAANFCLQAAERCADQERRTIYHNLVAWRVKHREMWRRIRREYSRRTGDCGVFDPDNYVLSNPWTMASLTGYGTDPNDHGRLTGREAQEQILRDAVRRSQGIIIFYHGLKEFARSSDSHMMIDNMIADEEGYVRLLTRAWERMQASRAQEGNRASVGWAELEPAR